MPVLFDALDQPGGFELGDDALARLEAIEAAEARGRLIVERGLRREDVDLLELVPLADLVVVEIVRRRDLHAAGAELSVDVAVGDDGDQPLGERQPQALSDQVRGSDRPRD